MSEEHRIGADLRRELERLSARIEVLERDVAEAKGITLDWNAIDEKRIDLDVAFDRLDDDVQGAIDDTFRRVTEAIARKMTE